MKRPRLGEMSVDDLVERFADSCLREFKAELEGSIEAIRNSKMYRQAMDAGMCIWTLEQGIFKPT